MSRSPSLAVTRPLRPRGGPLGTGLSDLATQLTFAKSGDATVVGEQGQHLDLPSSRQRGVLTDARRQPFWPPRRWATAPPRPTTSWDGRLRRSIPGAREVKCPCRPASMTSRPHQHRNGMPEPEGSSHPIPHSCRCDIPSGGSDESSSGRVVAGCGTSRPPTFSPGYLSVSPRWTMWETWRYGSHRHTGPVPGRRAEFGSRIRAVRILGKLREAGRAPPPRQSRSAACGPGRGGRRRRERRPQPAS